MAGAIGYRLCETCARRQGGNRQRFEVVPGSECFICGGLLERLDAVAEGARDARHYEFRTFGVGLTMPAGIQEREDEVRSALQLKGERTVKAQISLLLSAKLARGLRRRASKADPDLTILFDLANSRVSLHSRSVFFYGRYTKPRGVAQRRELCRSCWGKGCEACAQTGHDLTPSVEEKLGRKLMEITGASGTKFTWIGSEDVESLVDGNGRPFVVELKSPRRRKVPRTFVVGGKGGRVRVTRGAQLRSKPTRLPTFKFLARIFATAAKKISPEELHELKKTFRGATVVFDRPNERPVSKKVYRVGGRARGGKLFLDAEIDGGLPVKRFVNGDLVSPSVAEVLKTEVRCDKFDVCRVRETGEFEFG